MATDGFEKSRRSVTDWVRQEWQGHLGLIAAGILGLVIVFRLLAVANYDFTTALAVLATTGTANVITGTLITLIPGFLPMVSGLLLAYASQPKYPGVEFAAILVLAFCSSLFADLTVLTITALYSVLFYFVLKGENGLSKRFQRSVLLVCIGFLIVSGISQTSPWLPRQLISLEETGTIDGYVLNDDGDYWAILTAGEREIRWISSSDVEDRQLCQYGGWDSTSLIELLVSTTYPRCPT